MASQSTKVSTLVRSLVMSSPNFRSHAYSASESVPPGPELPESFFTTDYTASSVMSTGTKICVSSYVSNVPQEGIVLLGCFPSKTDVTVSFILPVRSSANFQVEKLPPFLFHRQIVRLRAILDQPWQWLRWVVSPLINTGVVVGRISP